MQSFGRSLRKTGKIEAIECPFTRFFNIHSNQIRNGFISLNNELDLRVRTKQESWKRTDKVLQLHKPIKNENERSTKMYCEPLKKACTLYINSKRELK